LGFSANFRGRSQLEKQRTVITLKNAMDVSPSLFELKHRLAEAFKELSSLPNVHRLGSIVGDLPTFRPL
jgi:hypothetical protein